MTLTCVLLMPPQSMLSLGLINTLLGSVVEIKVISSEAADLNTLIREIENIGPNIILIGETMPLAKKEVLVQLLMCFPELRVIVISEETNWLHVFHKKDLLLTSRSDLLDIVYSH